MQKVSLLRGLIVRCKVENINLIHVGIIVKITQCCHRRTFLENASWFLSCGEQISCYQYLLKQKLSFCFILGCSFISIAFLISWSMHLDLLARILIFKEDPIDKFSVFHTCSFVWFVLSSGMMVFIDPDLDFVRSLSSIHFFTFMVDVVCMVQKLWCMQNKVLCVISNFLRCIPLCSLYVAFKILYINDSVAELYRNQAEVLLIMTFKIFTMWDKVKYNRIIRVLKVCAVQIMTVQLTDWLL